MTLTGEKLPPFIIFKGVPNGRVARKLRQADYNGTQGVCTVQKCAWMDEATFLYWTNAVWQPFCSRNEPTCLIMDSCSVHETSSIKEALTRLGTKILYIPRGYTGRLQVLDVGVNHPFKLYMREQNESFLGGGVRKVSHLHIIQWIIGSWRRMSAESITNTWRTVGYKT